MNRNQTNQDVSCVERTDDTFSRSDTMSERDRRTGGHLATAALTALKHSAIIAVFKSL